MEKPHIKVLQYMHGDVPYFPYSEWINRRYCERHGYRYVVRRDAPRKDRHICWQKVPLILEELHDCEQLLFVDADAVFYSQELTIENEILPLLENKLLLMASDCGEESARWNPELPNSGVIFMRSCDRVREIVSQWNRVSEFDEQTRWTWPPEQIAMWRHILPQYRDEIHVLADYYRLQGRFGHYIRHLCLSGNEFRVESFKSIYSRLSRNISK